jgi:hypothetical protein
MVSFLTAAMIEGSVGHLQSSRAAIMETVAFPPFIAKESPSFNDIPSYSRVQHIHFGLFLGQSQSVLFLSTLVAFIKPFKLISL